MAKEEGDSEEPVEVFESEDTSSEVVDEVEEIIETGNLSRKIMKLKSLMWALPVLICKNLDMVVKKTRIKQFNSKKIKNKSVLIYLFSF